MLTISHRGHTGEGTENTLEAFHQVDRLGVDGIETDIRMTADGHLVLFHDRHLADGSAVCDLDYADLTQRIGYTAPTLEDALSTMDHLLWVLELKDPSATEKFLATIKPFVASRRLLVISFWHDVICELQQQLEVECGVTVAHRPADFQAANLQHVRTIIWRCEYIDKQLIEESSAAGHCNLVYNLQGIEEHRKCYEWGVDGIITDEPLLAVACKAE
ncbi:MAG: glycerophosphodiester phosphodiesterase [Pirellulales bacterium]|nr:glycerophosphodiester phosphodiesterase [Pirellulales bacterium]